MKRILIVEDNDGMRKMLKGVIAGMGHEFCEAEDGEDALAMLADFNCDLVITDLRMPRMDGISLLRKIKRENLNQLVIIITGHGTIETAVEAMKYGAHDYILKPFRIGEMEVKIEKALKQGQLISENQLLRESAKRGFGRIIGSSLEMLSVFRLVKKVSNSTCPVLILGESGTGKELIARELHEMSDRKLRPFVPINCAVLAEGLLESELFGHEKGAFTGALYQKKGKFELAEGGTLFLDEVGELSQKIQVKLLRFLQEKELERVGGNKTIKVDVRIVCATNRNIKVEIQEKRFREDLYYRINVVQIDLPPLMKRKEDIPELVHYFLDRHSKALHKPLDLDDDVMPYLLKYNWRGNIRELENVVERAVVLSDGGVIRKENLPMDITGGVTPVQLPFHDSNMSLTERLELFEMESIKKVLESNNGNQTKTSQKLGLKRSSLQYKIKKYGL